MTPSSLTQLSDLQPKLKSALRCPRAFYTTQGCSCGQGALAVELRTP